MKSVYQTLSRDNPYKKELIVKMFQETQTLWTILQWSTFKAITNTAL